MEIYHQFLEGMKQTTWLEYIAVIAGIASVWFSRKENILVYPVGLVNTIIYIYLSIKGNLFGEASVNFYYTVMSVYGWMLWAKKDNRLRPETLISISNKKEWQSALLFFSTFYMSIFFALIYIKKSFAPDAIPAMDALASASAYTGMWLMAKKKLESWYWWIITDLVSVPLYFIKGYVFTSVQFFVFLILAIAGLLEWQKRLKKNAS